MSLEARNISFSYGSRKILDSVSFGSQPGELLAVLGANGAGKSTLFRCLLGLIPPGGGEVLVDGRPLKDWRVAELARKIAYVPQSQYPSFNYSVFDMMLMGTTAQLGRMGTPGAEQSAVAELALESLEIGHLRRRGYTEISGGERQLVLIARALAQQARVIIMDEPTANLDYGNQLRVLQRIKALTQEGYTVIQSTHSPEHALLFADRVLALHDGRVAALGAPSKLLTSELIERLYGVRVEFPRLPAGTHNSTFGEIL